MKVGWVMRLAIRAMLEMQRRMTQELFVGIQSQGLWGRMMERSYSRGGIVGS